MSWKVSNLYLMIQFSHELQTQTLNAWHFYLGFLIIISNLTCPKHNSDFPPEFVSFLGISYFITLNIFTQIPKLKVTPFLVLTIDTFFNFLSKIYHKSTQGSFCSRIAEMILPGMAIINWSTITFRVLLCILSGSGFLSLDKEIK